MSRLSHAVVRIALLLAVAGCGMPPPEPTLTPLIDPQPAALPGAGNALPGGAEGATRWVETADLPNAFDANANHASPDAVAAAFLTAIGGGLANREVDTWRGITGRVTLLITESGAGDDSVFGTQHALVIEPRDDGWALAQVYLRTLCRRDVDFESDLCV
jgi:hypothetical protein